MQKRRPPLHPDRGTPQSRNSGKVEAFGAALSTASHAFLARAIRLAKHSHLPILLTGESGSGKTWLARWLHEQSPRANSPYHALSLAAVDDSLAGSELFGHVAGAFTDARARRSGAFASAAGGTLFLDEIGKASLLVQNRLLTTIEDRIIRPLGSDNAIHVDVRLVFATNVDLAALVENGFFLPDLLARLAGFVLRVPSLRERREEIPDLIRVLLAKHAPRFGYSRAPSMDSRLLERLRNAPWPGNIRELDATLQSLLVEADGAEHLEPHHLVTSDEVLTFGTNVMDSLTPEELERVCRLAPSRAAAARQLGVSKATLFRRLRDIRDARREM